MSCSTQDCGKTIFAKGLCQSCYWRLRRNGSLERKNVVNHGTCSIDGCERSAFAKNLCSKHYQSERHPLYSTWKLLRSRAPGDWPADWATLDGFVTAVGERPSAKHQLRRLDVDLPWSTDNLAWRDPITSGKWTGTPEERAAYARAWSIRKKYGLTDEDFENMVADQDGKCAICFDALGCIDANTGRAERICIDHDHLTRKVRGLLCDPCNKGLGQFDDKIETLRAAIAYLEKHKPPE